MAELNIFYGRTIGKLCYIYVIFTENIVIFKMSYKNRTIFGNCPFFLTIVIYVTAAKYVKKWEGYAI